jgi:hypothetical protein
LDEARTELGNRPFDLGDWTRFRLLFWCFIECLNMPLVWSCVY